MPNMFLYIFTPYLIVPAPVTVQHTSSAGGGGNRRGYFPSMLRIVLINGEMITARQGHTVNARFAHKSWQFLNYYKKWYNDKIETRMKLNCCIIYFNHFNFNCNRHYAVCAYYLLFTYIMSQVLLLLQWDLVNDSHHWTFEFEIKTSQTTLWRKKPW